MTAVLLLSSWALKITAKQKVINVNLVSEENKLRSKEMWK